jgi:hypothetical protein
MSAVSILHCALIFLFCDSRTVGACIPAIFALDTEHTVSGELKQDQKYVLHAKSYNAEDYYFSMKREAAHFDSETYNSIRDQNSRSWIIREGHFCTAKQMSPNSLPKNWDLHPSPPTV